MRMDAAGRVAHTSEHVHAHCIQLCTSVHLCAHTQIVVPDKAVWEDIEDPTERRLTLLNMYLHCVRLCTSVRTQVVVPHTQIVVPHTQIVVPDKAVWEDIEDPTERLALALGLDPKRLAVYTGLPTTDA